MTAFGGGTSDAFLLVAKSILNASKVRNTTHPALTETGTTAVVAAGETREVHATERRKWASREARPVEAFLLIFIALVGRASRAGVGLVRDPVLDEVSECFSCCQSRS